ncbi:MULTISPECIES: zinc-dependent metalloprotease [Flavobacterium]|uniref:Secretion system C-terminal sorting domain-containing protein n=1 Tax=Flavobacterium hankyongi TaxID=1176532 RepID=A0ABP8ZRL1_9FLAO|nr:zinc-dependent metalloprotease family protein [Flavobacterium sp. N1846]
MKKQLLIALTPILLSGYANAQANKFWEVSSKGKENVVTAKGVARESFPKDFMLFDLNSEAMRQTLFSAVNNTSKKSAVISLPNAEGGIEQFEVFEASNFDAELQAQFPEIRAFSGKGLTDKYATLKISISPEGIQTMVFRVGKENEFMEPYSADRKVYAVYKSQREKGKLNWTCSVDDKKAFEDISNKIGSVQKSSAGQLKTMRLAQSCTAEYSNYFGATSAAQVNLVLAAFNATLTRCNGVYERELGLHLNLVAASTNVIYYNAATDPYSAAGSAGSGDGLGADGAWNAELQNTLSSVITEANYDIGHLFGASGGGGNAGCIGCVCVDGQKGSGFTSPADGMPQGDNFDIDYVVHEVGHQLGARHTFTHSRESGSTVQAEVGSGITIMGYAGITSYDVAPHSLDSYHAVSLTQIQTNLAGKTCPVTTSITANNATPVVNAGVDRTVPKSTPFMLTGSATDANAGDALTYSWEQIDVLTGAGTGLTAAGSSATATKTGGPNFISFAPKTSPTRYFPRMESVMAGSATTGTLGGDATMNSEALPSVARTLNFRLTVRDNAAYSSVAPVKVGQTNFDDMVVTVDATRGPLTVTSQNTNGIVWAQGSTQTITWAVNSTNTSVGGTNVDILLSTDNGATFTTVLLANTPNDGTETITVPNVTAANCRVMVKASGNIFFNVNTKNIAIGNYVYQTQNACNDYTFNLNQAFTESSDTSYPGLTLTVNDSFTITDSNFKANITHPNIGQVNILLMAPWQASLNTALWYNNTTCTAANMDKWFDTAGSAVNCANVNNGAFASAFTPFSAANINGYNGNNSAGGWKLYFKDAVVDSNFATARFNTFTIQLCYSQSVPVLSTESFEFEDFSLYPNPNKGDFTVKFTSSTGSDIKVVAHDLRGRKVYENSFTNTGAINQSVSLNNVESGIYLVSIIDGGKKTVKRVVIE